VHFCALSSQFTFLGHNLRLDNSEEKFYDGNFLLWLSYMLHTIEIENVFEKYFC